MNRSIPSLLRRRNSRQSQKLFVPHASSNSAPAAKTSFAIGAVTYPYPQVPSSTQTPEIKCNNLESFSGKHLCLRSPALLRESSPVRQDDSPFPFSIHIRANLPAILSCKRDMLLRL